MSMYCVQCGASEIMVHNSICMDCEGGTFEWCADVIISRHPGLVEYIEEELPWLLPLGGGTPVLQHASQEEISGKDVVGVLPLHLAALCKSVTEIPLKLTQEDRGKELSKERVAEIASDPVTYQVNIV